MILADFSVPPALWPYLVVAMVGMAPTIVWRMAGLVASSGLRDDSELMHWVRLVATALLMAVVTKLLLVPSGALGTIPPTGRFGALAIGLGSLFVFRRSILMAVFVGEVALFAISYLAR